MESKKIKLPAIVSDIDGVLYAGGALCGSSPQVVTEILTRKFGDGDSE